MPQKLLRFTRYLTLSVFLLLLSAPLLSATPAQAAEDYYIKINSPASGATISSPRFQVSVSWGSKPFKSNEWYLDLNIGGGSYRNKATVHAASGSYTFDVDLSPWSSRFPTDNYQVDAVLVVLTQFASGEPAYSTLASDRVTITYLAPPPGGAAPPVDNVAGGGGSVLPVIVGGGAAAAVAGLVVRAIARRGGRPRPGGQPSPPSDKGQDLRQEWQRQAQPAQRNDWDDFERFLNERFGPPSLKNFQDSYGRPSWASAYTAWQAEVKAGKTGASFEDWLQAQLAGQQQNEEMWAHQEKIRNYRHPGIVEAEEKVRQGQENKALFDHFTKIRKAVAGDARLTEFVGDAMKSVVDEHGQVDARKLARLQYTLERWIIRDKYLQVGEVDYTSIDAAYDTARQFTGNIIVRLGAIYLTGGYSEMVFNPSSAVLTMRESILEGKSNLQAVSDGFKQSAFELALGESGRLVKWAAPYGRSLKEGYNLSKLAKVNPDLASEVSTINQLAGQADDLSRYSRSRFMRSTDVNKVGQTATAPLDDLERQALNLNNNPEFRKLLAQNHDLVPSKVKDVMGIAKQKAYQQARDKAAQDVLDRMAQDGKLGSDPYFIKQTGTHARPDNPAWNSLKSDFDHGVDFGSPEYNQLYEQRFNAHLEAEGTSAQAIDANVYGAGTSSRGAYHGGATKFVENYNQTTGSDVMLRVEKGTTVISREEPQAIDSLLSKMKPADVASAKTNYQEFFQKSLDKGGSLDNVLQNTSKEVSRKGGQYSVDYVEHFQNTGKVNYQVPDAAKVADLVKKRGFTVDDAMKQVGYRGDKQQLLADYKKIMGL